jgi:GT2 family glycosyltransferase
VDGSTDDTLDMLACGRRPLDLNIIEQSNLGQPAALNAGIRAARGAYCLFSMMTLFWNGIVSQSTCVCSSSMEA